MVESRSSSGRRVLAVVAALGPLVYVAAVLLGGYLWSGYSHVAETISTLTSTGAPNQALLQPLFGFYNLALLALALVLHREVAATRWGVTGPAFLAGAGVAGLVLAFFPQGPWSDPLSGTGVAHTVIAGVDALCFLLAMGFLWRRFRADRNFERAGTFTLAMLAIGIVLGALGAAAIATPYAGLAERFSIGSFLLWSEVIALSLVRSSSAVATRILGARARRTPS